MSSKSKERAVIGIVVYNEAQKIKKVLKRVLQTKVSIPHKFIFVDDGSTDGTKKAIEKFMEKSDFDNYEILRNKTNKGVGAAIRKVIDYGREKSYTICTIMAGNGKDDPRQVDRLIKEIVEDGYDYIQGSRFLEGGSFKNLPLYRKVFIRVFTLTFFVLTGFRGTDSSNGYRAYRLSIFDDKKIDINQKWLDRYELETYLHYKVISLGYKITEVPVSKDYLKDVKSYTKMRPFLDWWKMARPLLLLSLGIRS